QLGIVLNHHLRKMSSENDAFDDVSGTLGLTGAADTIIVMKRHAGMAKIFVHGRDIEEGEFAAEFNRNTGRWRLMGDAAEVFRSKERQAIRAALKGATEPMSIPDIMAAVERDRPGYDQAFALQDAEGRGGGVREGALLARAREPLK